MGDSNAVVPLSFLISEESTALPHSHVEARGCLQFLCKAIPLRAVFLSARCMIKNRNHEPQRELGVDRSWIRCGGQKREIATLYEAHYWDNWRNLRM